MSKSRKWTAWQWYNAIIFSVIAVVLVALAVQLYGSWKDCRQREGLLVRALFGYVCLSRDTEAAR
jgi:predicted small integral membrane protein